MPKIYIRPHRKIFICFLIFTIIMIIAIIYSLLNESYGVKIIVSPKLEEIDTNFIAQIAPSGKLKGIVLEFTNEKKETFSPKANVQMEDYAEGKIVLTNNTWSRRKLVATTRFISPNGLIFRSIKPVSIPAKGHAEVVVRATEKGEKYDIGPVKFNIPGLTSPYLKENILAESKENMTGGIKTAGVVTQNDIDNAKKIIQENISKKIDQEIQNKLKDPAIENINNIKIITKQNILEEKCDAKANQEKSHFSITTKIKTTVLIFDEKEIENLALEKLKEKIPDGQKFLSYDRKTLTYRLRNYDKEKQQAELEIQCRGYSIINQENPILEKAKFEGLNRAEIKDYFKNYEEIKAVKVNLWPFFLRRIPNEEKRIEIIIK